MDNDIGLCVGGRERQHDVTRMRTGGVAQNNVEKPFDVLNEGITCCLGRFCGSTELLPGAPIFGLTAGTFGTMLLRRHS
jgi:hypothetical protein